MKRISRLIHSNGFHLFLISFTVLFAELLFIRWLPLQIRLLAYYSNLILLSALLGFGIGLILAHKATYRLAQWTPYFITALVVVVIFISQSNVLLPLADESNFIWNGLSRVETGGGPLSYLILIGIFLLNTILFIILSHDLGYWFVKLPSLRAYSIDIIGSLCGVLAFVAVAALSIPPIGWFFIFILLFFAHALSSDLLKKRELAIGVFLMGLTLLFVFTVNNTDKERTLWSPYYEIKVEDLYLEGDFIGSSVFVNKDGHQQMLDLSGNLPHSFLLVKKDFYELPYTFLDTPPQDVLILGAGTGNDVAAALRKEAGSVDAVEIDPVIAKLGMEHPERPYEDMRVQIFVDDARAFLERSDKTYDLIAFGFLDSHRLFSSMSSIRLENYLYTVENIQNIQKHLKEGGVLAITYTVHEQWIADRIFGLLRTTFNQVPVVYQGSEQAWGTIFLARKGQALSSPLPLIDRAEFEVDILPAAVGHTWAYSETSGFLSSDIFSEGIKLPTDDWPHLFLQKPGIPANYLAILLLVFAFSFILIRLHIPRLAFRQVSSWNFFFLGAGFALLETKGIAELAIVLGSTWITNAVVIAGILVMILFANLLVLKRISPPHIFLYGSLVVILLFNFFFSFTHLFAFQYSTRVILSALQVGLPIFFSGILFALYLKKAKNPTIALGANLLGAMFGGLFEYSSLIFGQSILFLFAIFFYFLSFLMYKWQQLRER